VPASRIRIERFAIQIPPPRAQAGGPCPQGSPTETRSRDLDGATRSVHARPHAGQHPRGGACATASSCPTRQALCATCRCRVVEGEVDMDANFALEDYEGWRAASCSACQTIPASDRVTVDFHQTGTG